MVDKQKDIKKETKNIKKDKVSKKPVKKELKKIFKIDYYMKDLITNKIIETNLTKFKEKYNYVFLKGPKFIFDGMNTMFPKVEAEMKKMKLNDEKTIVLEPKDAYGVRDSKLLKVIPSKTFKENKLNPIVGLTIDVGQGQYGTIRSVSGGRVMVDFNSPYADHKIEVFFKFLGEANDEEKVKAIIDTFLKGIKYKSLKLTKNKDNKNEVNIDFENSKDLEKEQIKQIISAVLKEFVVVDKVNITYS